MIREARCLGLVHEPQLGCVVFRYLPEKREVDADRVNPEIRRRLLQEGGAVIGHTRVHGHACLKLTILNPCVTEAQITALLEDVQDAGRQVELERT
jgi:L-2,4-diaminobutyrate decarboxylase